MLGAIVMACLGRTNILRATTFALCLAGCQPFIGSGSWFNPRLTPLMLGNGKAGSYQNEKGLRYAYKGQVAKAEEHFRHALEKNPSFAAAHNNLGNLLLGRHELYQAAWEFQRASELEPQNPTPLINLGSVHEAAGRLDEAADYYSQALDVDPNNASALGNLARIRVTQDADPTYVSTLLSQLLYIDNRPDWIEWTEDLLSTRYRMPSNGLILTEMPETSPASQVQPSIDSPIAPESNLQIPETLPTPNSVGPTAPEIPHPVTPTIFFPHNFVPSSPDASTMIYAVQPIDLPNATLVAPLVQPAPPVPIELPQ